MSGNVSGVNPPENSPCRDCWFGNLRTNPSFNGGGDKRITIEGLEDFNRTLRALGALIENIAVSLGVGIEGTRLFSDIGMHNRARGKGPVEVMEHESTAGGG